MCIGLEPRGVGWAKENKSMRKNKLFSPKIMIITGKTHVFLPVHPKCKSLKPEVFC